MHYDATKLLSLQDIKGNKPELFLITSNRSDGKTTTFVRLLCNKWYKTGEKFCIVYRFSYELDDCADKIFKDVSSLFFNNDVMTQKRRGNGAYVELFINDKPCGYAVSVNAADNIKKHSHQLSDVARMFFDEFQSETNHYAPDEVSKLISIHTSIARGGGKHVRYVPLYMCSNPVSLLNPYYVALGISDRLTKDTRYLRGDGFVLEQHYNAEVAAAQSGSGFNRAFASHSYVAYAAQGVYLNDNQAFIETPSGRSKYLATIAFKGKDYAIREYADCGVIYCDNKPDYTAGNRLAVTLDDHNINYVMLRKNDLFITSMRYYFDRGCFRFKNLECKAAILGMLSY